MHARRDRWATHDNTNHHQQQQPHLNCMAMPNNSEIINGNGKKQSSSCLLHCIHRAAPLHTLSTPWSVWRVFSFLQLRFRSFSRPGCREFLCTPLIVSVSVFLSFCLSLTRFHFIIIFIIIIRCGVVTRRPYTDTHTVVHRIVIVGSVCWVLDFNCHTLCGWHSIPLLCFAPVYIRIVRGNELYTCL